MTINNDFSNSPTPVSIQLPGIGQISSYVGGLAVTSLICFALVKYAPSNPSKDAAREIGISLNRVEKFEFTQNPSKSDEQFKSQQLEDLDATTNSMMMDMSDY